MNAPEILECGHEESPHSDITRGYGTDSDGKRACYACCAARDVAAMKEDGKTVLYLTKKDGRWAASNWPSSLVFPCWGYRQSRGVVGGNTYPIESARFHGPDGHVWSIVVRGDMELGRARRLKEKSRPHSETFFQLKAEG